MVVHFANGQLYRVYFIDKGENTMVDADFYDVPVNPSYLASVQELSDSVLLVSNWLNYALIYNTDYPYAFHGLPFIKSIEPVVHEVDITITGDEGALPGEKDDPNLLLAWQLDTMGHVFFSKAGIDGEGITIAVLDAGFSGVNTSPYFKHLISNNQIKATIDVIDGDSDVYHGSYHGCMVLSCMAGMNNQTPLGLATGANYILIRTEETLKETMADEDRWVVGIERAYQSGADVVNSSLGFTIPMHKKTDLNGESVISKAAHIATERGMIIINAAGNEYENVWKSITVPADANGVISVGAIGKSGDRLSFSSVGPTADGRLKPELSAPGRCYLARGNELVINQGTSFAAPVITGFVACMMQLKGKENVNRTNIIQSGSLFPYYDYEYGYGIPNPSKFENVSYTFLNDTTAIQLNKNNGEFIVKTKAMISDKVFFKIQDNQGIIKYYGSRRIIPGKPKRIRIPFKNSFPDQLHDKTYYHHPEPSDEWYFWIDGEVFRF